MLDILKTIAVRPQQLVGLLSSLLGLFVMAGWALHSQTMVTIVPGSVGMGFNTAILFVACGLCLSLYNTPYQTSAFIKFCVGLIIVLSGAILIENFFNVDLGIDWADLHARVKDGNPVPGRIAPNTSLGFFFIGLAFLFFARAATSKRARWLVTFLIYGALAISVSALLGYFLKLEIMYRIAAYNRMAAPTAIGMSILGISFLVLLQASVRGKQEQEDRRIVRISIFFLTILALAAGIIGFAVLQEGFEKSMADTAHLTAKNNATTIANTLEQHLRLTDVVTARPGLQKHLIRLNSKPNDREALGLVREVGNSFASLGISGIRFFNARKLELLTTGNLIDERATVIVKLARPAQQALLLWQDGFVLHTQNKVVRDGRVVGEVIIEQRLTPLLQLLTDIQGVGRSTDVLLCGREGDVAVCFPTRFYKANTRIPMFKADGSPNLAIGRALLNESGAFTVKDLRGIDVLAGYSPVSDLGLGLVVKIDTQELYAPLRERLHRLIALLVALVVAGGMALRMYVRPLAMRIVNEQRRMQIILESSHEAFIAIDQQQRITDWNSEAQRTFGWSRQEAIGKQLAELIIPPSKREAHHRGMAHFLATGHGPVLNQRIELEALHRSGKEFPVEITISSIKTENGYVFTAFLHDISDRKQSELKLHQQATCDLLTGLPNRAELMNRLQHAIYRVDRSKKPLAVMFLDIDKFKYVNDTFGHEAGDELLKEFARRLLTCVRKTDTVARLAGDEFIVIAESIVNGAEDAEIIANKIILALAKPIACGDGRRIGITASIGIAIYETGQESSDNLLSRADKAMYVAKQKGRNQFVVAGFSN